MGISGHPTCLQRNLYAGKKQQLELDMNNVLIQNWEEYIKVVLSPCLFNLYAKYLMWNVGLDDSQFGIKVAGRNINNLRYADATSLIAESEEELESLLMRMKEESEKAGLKLNIQIIKILISGSTTSRKIDGKKMETVTYFISWAPKSLQIVTEAMKLKDACSLEEKL